MTRIRNSVIPTIFGEKRVKLGIFNGTWFLKFSAQSSMAGDKLGQYSFTKRSDKQTHLKKKYKKKQKKNNMGHIVNAKSTRLGWSTIWCDQWYSERLFYPEFLHSMFRIKLYLIYIFTRRHFHKKAVFYSHFEILKYYKNIYVEVYYYSGKLETDYEDFKFEFFLKLYNLESNKDPETRKPAYLFTPIKVLLVWQWILEFNFVNLPWTELNKLTELMRKLVQEKLKDILLKKKKRKRYLFWKRFWCTYFNALFNIYKIKEFCKKMISLKTSKKKYNIKKILYGDRLL